LKSDVEMKDAEYRGNSKEGFEGKQNESFTMKIIWI